MTQDVKPPKLPKLPKRKVDIWKIIGYMIFGSALLMVLFVGVLMVLFLLGPDHAREQDNRMACSAHLAGITKSMMIYADEHAGAYPTVVTNSYASVAQAPAGGDTGSADATTAAQSLYTPGWRKASQCLWLMVIMGQGQPQQFVCRSDKATAALKTVSTSSSNWASDFGSSKNLSYAMASPWVEGEPVVAMRPPALARAPWWRNTGDATQPLLADGCKAGASFYRPEDMCPAHAGEGANVAYADGHAEWVPITKRGDHHALIAPTYKTNEDTSGVFAQGERFPTGSYVVPTMLTATKVGAVYDMIFMPSLVGR